jgi:hypothetical protein
MSDFVIATGDLVQVTIAAPAVVSALLQPVPLIGTGSTVSLTGRPICLVGDELPPVLRVPLSYIAAPFSNPGTGKLTLTLLPGNQSHDTENGKAILIKGGQFTALFTVTSPATQSTSTGPVPDPVLAKNGTARFMTTNTTVLGG